MLVKLIIFKIKKLIIVFLHTSQRHIVNRIRIGKKIAIFVPNLTKQQMFRHKAMEPEKNQSFKSSFEKYKL